MKALNWAIVIYARIMPSCWFLMNLTVVRHAGFLDFGLRYWFDVFWCSGRDLFDTHFDRSLHAAFLRRICGGKMLQRNGSHSVGVDLRIPEIMRLDWLSWISILFNVSYLSILKRHTLR